MKKKTVGIVGLAAAALVGGTFAYFTQTSTIDNPFDTAKYGTIVTEEFKPGDGKDWKPGVEISKKFDVSNTGDRPVVVRVKFEDIWKRNNVEIHKPNPVDTMTVFQQDPYDGEIEYTDTSKNDKSVVHKNLLNTGENGSWSDLQSDGYFYYLAKLDKQKTTEELLNSVTLDPNVDMGSLKTRYYYTTAETKPEINPENMEGWTLMTGKLQPATGSEAAPPEGSTFMTAITMPETGKLGYSDAEYTLRITVETVQATDKAVKTVFGNVPQAILEGWALDKEKLGTETD